MLAFTRKADVFEILVSKFNTLLDQNIDDGNGQYRTQAEIELHDVDGLLACFPDPRVGDLLIEAAATRLPATTRDTSGTFVTFMAFVDKQHGFDTVAQARERWRVNRHQSKFWTKSPACVWPSN